MDDIIITIILDNIDKTYMDFQKIKVGTKEFIEKSYEQWTLNTILNLIIDKPYIPVCSIINNFVTKMLYLYSFSINLENNEMFQIIVNTAEQLLYLCNEED